MVMEILEGRGCGANGDHVLLKLDHLGEEVLESRLPGVCELSKTFAHVDPVVEPVPVVPTCHYMMGGIPTNIGGQVLYPESASETRIIEGLYACGEVACVSVHGANRLGGNSLLDLVVFGRAAGIQIEKSMREGYAVEPASQANLDAAMVRLNRLNNSESGASIAEVRADLQTTMQLYFGVFREGESMLKGLELLREIRTKVSNLHLQDKTGAFNTDRIEALELQNLFEVAFATAISAEQRKESRGAHARNDFTERDDENWMKHTVSWVDSDFNTKIDYRPVHSYTLTDEIDYIPPKARVY